MIYARVLRIVGHREATRILESLGVTTRAADVLRRSTLHRVVHIGPLPNETARTLRREMTRLGGEAALPEPAWESDGDTDAVLAGTLSQFDDLMRALAVGDPELRRVGEAISRALQRDASPARVLRLPDRYMALDRTFVMGVLNVTPDSFSDGGQFVDSGAAVARAEEMEAEGADFIDIGGASSRPGADVVSPEEELRRVLPVVERVVERTKLPVSVDTTRAAVAAPALDLGAVMINDISALRADPAMTKVVADRGAAVVLMHMRGTPETMVRLTDYDDVVSEVYRFLGERSLYAAEHGIEEDRLLVDPGLGFAKTTDQSLTLLQRLGEFRSLGLPVVVGSSRKNFIGAVLGKGIDDRGAGSLATVAWAVFAGARVVRVHEVAPAVDVARMADAVLGAAL